MQPRNAEPVRFGIALEWSDAPAGRCRVGRSFDVNTFMDWDEQRAAVDKFLRLARRDLMHSLKQHRKRGEHRE